MKYKAKVPHEVDAFSFFFSELPRYIGYILGFSASTGRMYFADREGTAYMSSYNCKDVELTANDALPNDIEEAINVPGKSVEVVEAVEWPSDSDIKADFDGIWDKGVLSAKWRTCCEEPV
jgi:hypothetical protein